MKEETSPISGLTANEDTVMAHLAAAHRAFFDLPYHHPTAKHEWTTALHQLQSLVADRIVSRDYPQFWTQHTESEVQA